MKNKEFYKINDQNVLLKESFILIFILAKKIFLSYKIIPP